MSDIIDIFERKRFTGDALVAVDLDRPPEFIVTFMERLRKFLPELRVGGIRAEFDDRNEIFVKLGAAVVPVPPEVLAELVLKRQDLFGGVVVGSERYVYTPRPAKMNKRMAMTPLEAMKVEDGHAGKVKVLVLDTGLETTHPDFISRGATACTFVGGIVEDKDGHGTHCTGLACGPRTPKKGKRYGVACEAEIVTGRVMNTGTGSASDKVVCRALEWAMANGVVVVNMSFGGDVKVDEKFAPEFENIAARALAADVLLVAAAGNDPKIAEHPVEHPANCPSVMAVAALNELLEPSDESCVARNPGQNIDVAAPGCRIRSSFVGRGYRNLSGTSMATAFVSGIAALWADTPSKPRGCALWKAVCDSAVAVSATSAQVGAGLVQAPTL